MSLSLRIAAIISCLRRAAPYLAIELILPGGSLIALTLWILKNRKRLRRRSPPPPPAMRGASCHWGSCQTALRSPAAPVF
jgi:hypothetical protein